ncbi:MAG: chemotaxis protein CheB, partial [Proteobacteria bacterium]
TIIALVHEETQTKRAVGLGAKHVLCKKAGTDADESRLAALILDILSKPLSASVSTSATTPKRLKAKFADNWTPRAIVIASSTGGPPVLEKIFAQLRPPLHIPVFMVQHMPEFFTRELAQRLTTVSGLVVREAIDGEEAKAGVCYMAPGNYHMQLVNTAQKVIIRLNQDEKLHSVRPAADYLFHTAAAIYARDCLGIVLTGMGADGADGALGIKKLGGHVVIQDKESCAVWGMPGAVHALGAFDAIEDVDSIAAILRQSMVRNAA